MDITRISDDEVRQALERLRRAEPLRGSSLLEMVALANRLVEEGLDPSPDTLEWAIGEWLAQIMSENLVTLRRAAGLDVRLTGLDRMALDFDRDNADLEAWSYLHYRYAAGLGLQQQDLAALARPGYPHANRHLQRRAALGFKHLARVLRDAEIAACRPGSPGSANQAVTALPAGMLGFLAVDAPKEPRRDHAGPVKGGADFDARVLATISAGDGHLALPPTTAEPRALAYFKTPAGAIEAAIALAGSTAGSERRPDDRSLRIAVHAGEVDWMGTAATSCLRLCAAGHGGQVLVSAAGARFGERKLPAGWSLRSLGAHRLDDLSQAQTVYELVATASETPFPPLLKRRWLDANLPLPDGPFLGEMSQLDALGTAIRISPWVTLHGPGGVGRTRLALELAHERAESFAGGVRWVDLSVVDDPRWLTAELGAALQSTPRQLVDWRAAVVEATSHGSTLLVLDGVGAGAQPFAAELIDLAAQLPALRILAIADAPIGLTGEHAWAVASLPCTSPSEYSAARQLFVQSAVAAGAGPVNGWGDLSVLCERLAGNPLALLLAAPMSARWSPAVVQERLGPATTEPSEILDAVFNLACDDLVMSGRILLKRLAVFRGGWTGAAAVAVCSGDGLPPESVPGLLHELVTAGLVSGPTEGAAPRYGMHQAVWRRCHNMSVVGVGSEGLLAGRHLTWLVGLADAAAPLLDGPDAARWLERIARERHNIRAALTYASSCRPVPDDGLRLAVRMSKHWLLTGQMAEGRVWLEELLAGTDGSIDPAVRAAALREAGTMAHALGDAEVAEQHYRASLAKYRTLGDQAGAAMVLDALGTLSRSRADTVAARALHDQAAAVRLQLADREGLGESLVRAGVMAQEAGDLVAAWAAFSAARVSVEHSADPALLALILGHLADVAWLDGDLVEAGRNYEAMLEITRDQGDDRGTAKALIGLGCVAHARGDTVEAYARFEDSLQLSRRAADASGTVRALRNLGSAAMDGPLAADAGRFLSESLYLAQETGDTLGTIEAIELLAVLHYRAGDAVRSTKLLAACAVWREAAGKSPSQADAPARDQLVAALQEQLGRSAYDDITQEGRGLDVNAAGLLAPLDSQPFTNRE